MFTSEVLTLEVDGPVATLYLDRAAKRNALGRAFWRDLGDAAAELDANDDVRAVVLAARGPCFS
ncbi:MAG: enoyl-CoA hydratase, partial [Acidimicrobiales bacterium]